MKFRSLGKGREKSTVHCCILWAYTACGARWDGSACYTELDGLGWDERYKSTGIKTVGLCFVHFDRTRATKLGVGLGRS